MRGNKTTLEQMLTRPMILAVWDKIKLYTEKQERGFGLRREFIDELNSRVCILLEMTIGNYKIKNLAFDEFKCWINFGLKKELESAVKSFEIIENGTNFKSLLGKIKFNEMLESGDKYKLKHLAESF